MDFRLRLPADHVYLNDDETCISSVTGFFYDHSVSEYVPSRDGVTPSSSNNKHNNYYAAAKEREDRQYGRRRSSKHNNNDPMDNSSGNSGPPQRPRRFSDRSGPPQRPRRYSESSRDNNGPPQIPERCLSVCSGMEPSISEQYNYYHDRATTTTTTATMLTNIQGDSGLFTESEYYHDRATTTIIPRGDSGHFTNTTHSKASDATAARRSWTDDVFCHSPPRKPTRENSTSKEESEYEQQQQQQQEPNNVETIPELNIPHLTRLGTGEQPTATANKRLAFAETKMVGREIQSSLLAESLQNHAKRAMMRSHVVQIHGESGTGKTRLAQSIQSTSVFRSLDNPLFVHGKFDMLHRDVPYAGIVAALEVLAERILQLDNEQDSLPLRSQSLANKLVAAIDTEELVLLIKLVPLLGIILGIDPRDHPQTSVGNNDNDMFIDRTKTRFREAIRRFLCVVCQSFSTVVFLLDDLQFADDESLALLQGMLEPQQEYSLLCIVVYRSSELHESLQKTLAHWEHQSATGRIDLTQIPLSHLSKRSVHLYMQDLLDVAPDEAANLDALASICHQRTGGNPFFLNSFLTMLTCYGHLSYDLDQHKWTWDAQQVDIKTQSTTRNAVELQLAQMTTLGSQSSLEILRLAACLGSTCKESVLHALWFQLFGQRYQCDQDTLEQVFKTSLDLLCSEGFWHKHKDLIPVYQWNHDQIRSGAMLLTPEKDRNEFQCQVGEALATHLKSGDLESMIFVVAHLVNPGFDTNDKQRQLQFARLNLLASQHATTIAAFTNAKMFAAKGLSFLPEDKWVQSNDLCHELFTCLIRAERVCGDISSMEKHCQELIEAQTDKPISTRLGATINLCYGGFYSSPALGSRRESLEVGITALEELGCAFPRNQITTGAKTMACMTHLKKVRNKLAKADGDLKLDKMIDPPKNIRETCKLLFALMPLSELCNDARFPLIVGRLVEYTLQYGISIYAPSAFAAAAPMFTGPLNDLKGGALFAKCALKLTEMVKYRPIIPGTRVKSYGQGLVWTTPACEAATQLQLAHECGVRAGDRGCTEQAGCASTLCSFLAGCPLGQMVSNCRTQLQLERARTDFHAHHAEFQLMAFLSFQGKDTDEVVESINSWPIGAPSKDDPTSDKNHLYVFWTKKLLNTYMGDFDLCAETSLAQGESIKKSFPGSPMSMMDPFLRGLSCLVVARRSGKKSMLKEGKSMLAIISDWVNQGNPNVVHYEAIMKAELSAIKKKSRGKVLAKYQNAVDLAKQVGCMHDAALFYECWGLYALECLEAHPEASACIRQSIQLFSSWGANGKVQKMQSQYFDLLGGGNSSPGKASMTASNLNERSGSPTSSMDLSIAHDN
ncbi:Transcriptional regulator [Seminavis robusta]|uniref:Transcriptional regulator n=1 Tax=Seminavis robusta TaxID=568900 RepID=A0A9N8E541_9STRA|nr:Transcriptional regulator [Seminavis robusta]|eukprot:Sro509_g157120.1 Transcriptional regulator (1350) ;mRNA; f:49437-53580